MKKTQKRENRLRSAKNWIKTYSGNNIVKSYSKKYSVDKLCAVKELRMIGVEISDEYEKQLINSMKALKRQRLSFKKKREDELKALTEFESDENFAMILGYTSGGAPYGLTHEEINNENLKEHQMDEEHISQLKKLLTEWNPLGKYTDNVPGLNDYETEACDILFFLDSKSSVKKIDKMITEVLTQAFDININPKKSLECAEKLKVLLMKK